MLVERRFDVWTVGPGMCTVGLQVNLAYLAIMALTCGFALHGQSHHVIRPSGIHAGQKRVTQPATRQDQLWLSGIGLQVEPMGRKPQSGAEDQEASGSWNYRGGSGGACSCKCCSGQLGNTYPC
jgi:hypothetical protein